MSIVKITFAPTYVISVEKNTAKEFKAVLKDSMGVFQARVRRLKKDKVVVEFEGTPTRNINVEYARWEWSPIWDNLAEQGHAVKAIA